MSVQQYCAANELPLSTTCVHHGQRNPGRDAATQPKP
jgi:hypothetical protein